MRIPKGAPDPGRVGRVRPAPTRTAGPEKKAPPRSTAGLAAAPAPPKPESTAGILHDAIRKVLPGPSRQSGKDLEAGAARHAVQEQQDRAQVQYGLAMAALSATVAGAGVGASVGAASPGAVAAKTALADLAVGQRKSMVDTIGALRRGDTEAARASFESVVKEAPPKDIMSLVQHAVRQSYKETLEDLAGHAEKVKHFNDQKKALREQLRGLRAKGGAAREIRRVEGELQKVGEDWTLAQMDLQNAVQKQQQSLRMISNVARKLHETAMSIVRKMG